MQVFSQFDGFEWDQANKEKNWKRHEVTWWECEEVFFNQPLYVSQIHRDVMKEERFFVLGRTNSGRLLFIVFTRRGTKVRVISARDMHKKERKMYHEKAQTDSEV